MDGRVFLNRDGFPQKYCASPGDNRKVCRFHYPLLLLENEIKAGLIHPNSRGWWENVPRIDLADVLNAQIDKWVELVDYRKLKNVPDDDTLIRARGVIHKMFENNTEVVLRYTRELEIMYRITTDGFWVPRVCWPERVDAFKWKENKIPISYGTSVLPVKKDALWSF
jgi:hypothetical protein